ncbi:MAG: type II toxin-antitoxin system VapC family toxin [Pseudomonadota bacterium]|nr:type II toxin-antitoxin system VapC family toxin [Pseudomonadota bacterium]
MSTLFLLDTNVISELAKQRSNPGVEAQILARQADCALAALTVEELCFGVARLPKSARRDLLERWLEGVLQQFTLLPIDYRAALWLGRERARLADAGLPAPRADGEIAAVAAINGLTLITRNQKDFANFNGLRVDSWFVD